MSSWYRIALNESDMKGEKPQPPDLRRHGRRSRRAVHRPGTGVSEPTARRSRGGKWDPQALRRRHRGRVHQGKVRHR